jgi:hypothetical protein
MNIAVEWLVKDTEGEYVLGNQCDSPINKKRV